MIVIEYASIVYVDITISHDETLLRKANAIVQICIYMIWHRFCDT